MTVNDYNCYVRSLKERQLHEETERDSVAFFNKASHLTHSVHEIAVPISQSHQHSWWGLVLVETRPVRWVTLHNVHLSLLGDVVRWLFMYAHLPVSTSSCASPSTCSVSPVAPSHTVTACDLIHVFLCVNPAIIQSMCVHLQLGPYTVMFSELLCSTSYNRINCHTLLSLCSCTCMYMFIKLYIFGHPSVSESLVGRLL